MKYESNMLRISATTLALALSLGLSACGGKKKTYTSVDGSTSVEVDEKQGKFTVRSKDGQVDFSVDGGPGAKIPDDFPADIPIYKKSKVTTGMSMAGSKTVILESSDPGSTVMNFYTDSLNSAGWEQKTEMNTGPMMVKNFEKGPRRISLNVMDDPKTGPTTITLSTFEKPK